jgi:saccharopepsin
MTVTGQWVNAFNSVAGLVQLSNGEVVGTYSSTTGSSGAYWVVGFTDPDPPADGSGQALALSILWRSYQEGTPDPSWHYVSGFSGQLVTLQGVPTLNLIHDMVATTPFSGAGIDTAGSYLDKLTYTPYASPNPSSRQWPPPISRPSLRGGINGTWVATQCPDTTLSLQVQDDTWGYVTGTLTTSAGTANVVGFTDPYAASGGLNLQGLSISALLPDGHSVLALAGALDLGAGLLSLSSLRSGETQPASTWIQTRMEAFTFNPQ